MLRPRSLWSPSPPSATLRFLSSARSRASINAPSCPILTRAQRVLPIAPRRDAVPPCAAERPPRTAIRAALSLLMVRAKYWVERSWRTWLLHVAETRARDAEFEAARAAAKAAREARDAALRSLIVAKVVRHTELAYVAWLRATAAAREAATAVTHETQLSTIATDEKMAAARILYCIGAARVMRWEHGVWRRWLLAVRAKRRAEADGAHAAILKSARRAHRLRWCAGVAGRASSIRAIPLPSQITTPFPARLRRFVGVSRACACCLATAPPPPAAAEFSDRWPLLCARARATAGCSRCGPRS